jgi:hypothetical protein
MCIDLFPPSAYIYSGALVNNLRQPPDPKNKSEVPAPRL